MSTPTSQLVGLRMWWRSRSIHSSDAGVRIKAIEKLTELGDGRAVSLLTDALSDAEPEVRKCAAAGLGEIGDESTLTTLEVLVLQETESEVSYAAAASMMKLDGDQCVKTLLNGLDAEDPAIRHNAASALRRVAWERLSDVDRARVAIAQCAWPEVVKIGPPAIEPLADVIRNGTQRAQREAADALGQIGTVEAGQILADLLSDENIERSGREIVAWALRSHFWDKLDEECAAQVAIAEGNWDEAVRQGEAAVTPLSAALFERDVPYRINTANALADIGGDEAGLALAKALADLDQDPQVRITAAKGLGQIAQPNVMHVLIEALGDECWPVRDAAAAALRARRWVPKSDSDRAWLAVANQYWDDVVVLGEAAIEPLVDALRHRTVATAAARTLLQLGPAGLDRLLVLLRDAKQPMSVREIVARTLAEIGDRRAIEPVEEMLHDSDMVVRQAAVWTLEKLGWQPVNDTQRALAAIANEDWEALGPLGPAAIEPLLSLAAEGMAPAETVSALHHVLMVAAERLSVEDLRAIASVGDAQARRNLQNAKYVGSASSASTALEFKQVRALAGAELARRGIAT